MIWAADSSKKPDSYCSRYVNSYHLKDGQICFSEQNKAEEKETIANLALQSIRNEVGRGIIRTTVEECHILSTTWAQLAQEEQLDLIFPYSLGEKNKLRAVQAGLYIKANLDQWIRGEGRSIIRAQQCAWGKAEQCEKFMARTTTGNDVLLADVCFKVFHNSDYAQEQQCSQYAQNHSQRRAGTALRNSH